MKIRTGFVSNSSSSSFIIIGNKVLKSKVSKELESGLPIYGVLIGGGTSGSVDDFIVKLSPEIYALLKQFKYLDDFEFYRAVATRDEDEILVVDKEMTGMIFKFQKDYSSSDDIDGVISWIKRR